jgi:hypothetical protein
VTTITHYKNDDLPITVPVTFEAGSGVTTLTGATVEAEATDGFHTVAGSATVTGDGSSVLVTFDQDVFRAGVYDLAVRATVGTVTQTIATAQIVVNP